MLKGLSGIYRIINDRSGRGYVGQAFCLARRKTVHLSALKNGRHHNRWLQRAWDRNKEDPRFRFTVLELCPQDKLTEREQFWIDAGYGQYNLSRTVDVPGSRKWTKAQREKQATRLQGNKLAKGYRHGIETLALISQAAKGRTLSQLGRKKASQRMKLRNKTNPPRRGVPCSEEHRRKLSQSRRNHDSNKGPQCPPSPPRNDVPGAESPCSEAA